MPLNGESRYGSRVNEWGNLPAVLRVVLLLALAFAALYIIDAIQSA